MRKKRNENSNLRINIIMGAFLFVCLVFTVRLFQIQVLQRDQYKALASEQYRDLQTIHSKRGDILSSDGFTLATTQNHYLIFMEPAKVAEQYKVVEELSKYLSKAKASDPNNSEEVEKLYLSYKERFTGIAGSGLVWAILEHSITPPQKEEIEKMGFSGIGFQEEPVRYYPEKSLASHVLGFVASNERGEKQGYYGIEGRLDGELKGKPGRVIEEKDALGTPILVGDHKIVEPIDGSSVVLTINRSVQHIVETKLKEGVEKYDAVSGSVVVMDPFSGKILAMANYPTYDPANFADEAKETTVSPHRKTVERTNLAIAETYEPGSVIKPLTVSSAIDLGKVSPNTTFEDRGPVEYSGYWIDNWDGKHHGTLTIIQLLQKSNNIGAAWVGHLVGSKNIYNYFSDFGIGQRPGVDLEGEDTGVLRDYKGWTDIDLANISFGQGMSATPLQVLNAFNVMANGGKLMQPQIISEIRGDGDVRTIPPKEIREVISPKTAKTMVGILTQAVSGGEAAYYVSKIYDVAGKTGTAQIPKDGKYDPKLTNATFVGFLSNSKKFSMIVRLDRPSTSTYAAETAVPLWMEMTDELVKYFGIPPDKDVPISTPTPVPVAETVSSSEDTPED